MPIYGVRFPESVYESHFPINFLLFISFKFDPFLVYWSPKKCLITNLKTAINFLGWTLKDIILWNRLILHTVRSLHFGTREIQRSKPDSSNIFSNLQEASPNTKASGDESIYLSAFENFRIFLKFSWRRNWRAGITSSTLMQLRVLVYIGILFVYL